MQKEKRNATTHFFSLFAIWSALEFNYNTPITDLQRTARRIAASFIAINQFNLVSNLLKERSVRSAADIISMFQDKGVH